MIFPTIHFVVAKSLRQPPDTRALRPQHQHPMNLANRLACPTVPVRRVTAIAFLAMVYLKNGLEAPALVYLAYEQAGYRHQRPPP